MSSKNLKVYKMQFITQLKRLHLNVKFPCQIKMTWKRSNQSTQSSLVSLKNGVVQFNETLRLPVNMYFNTTTQSFVQKKCLYSFTIATEKGQKSAGSLTVDLAQLLNKRVYELDQAFMLQKCPVNGTKVQMKIHYEEQTTEQGYDSMSCISATNPMDSSSASIDISDLAPTKSNISEKESQQQTQKSQKSDFSVSEKLQNQTAPKKQQVYTTLDVSDVLQSSQKDIRPHDGTKIGQNIKNINSLTNKINQFVNDKSKNIKFEIEGFRRKINSLQEQLLAQRLAKQKLEAQLTQQKKRNATLSKQFQNFKDETSLKLQALQRKNTQLQTKQSNSQQLIHQLEQKMNQSGQSQSNYLEQLKANHKTAEIKLNQQIQSLRQNLVQEKKSKNELASKLTTLEGHMRQLKQKFQKECEKNNVLEEDMRRKEVQLENTRINLQKAFQNLVAALNGVV